MTVWTLNVMGEVHGVYATREAAEKAQSEVGEQARRISSIEEWEVQP